MQRDLAATNIPVDVLRSFVAVLDIGSLAQAADHLHLTPAGLNGQIKKLQNHLGDSLFLRADHGLKPTDKGEVLLGYARRILEMNDKIISLSGRNPDRVRIGIPKVYAGTFLEGANLACVSGMPGPPPAFFCDISDGLTKSLLQNFLDVAVLTEQNHLRTATEFVWCEPLVWARSPNLTPPLGCPLPVIGSANGIADQLANDVLSDANIRHEIVFATADWNARMAAAKAGLGYVIAPRRVIPAALQIAQDDFLPGLRDLRCAIHVSPQIDVKKIRPILVRLAEIFVPHDQDKNDTSDHILGKEMREARRSMHERGEA